MPMSRLLPRAEAEEPVQICKIYRTPLHVAFTARTGCAHRTVSMGMNLNNVSPEISQILWSHLLGIPASIVLLVLLTAD